MAYFRYKTYNIFYEEIGNGTPLLLLHGNTASSVMFSEIAAKYSKNYKVILLDFLGCGKSDRVQTWEEDLWFDEAMQAIQLLEEKQYKKINIIGTSGGALAGLNIALERPDLVNKIIADSFEGEHANIAFTKNLSIGREASKYDAGARGFYEMMNGPDWEQVVDSDTQAVIAHAQHITNFFHKPLSTLKPQVLFTGSQEDSFFPDDFYPNLFGELIDKLGHGKQHIFEHGGHPAMLSNMDEFYTITNEFLKNTYND